MKRRIEIAAFTSLVLFGAFLFVVAGETLFSRYRILQINDSSLEFEDLVTGLKSSAALEEGATPGSRAAA
jgi:hypothetical protein